MIIMQDYRKVKSYLLDLLKSSLSLKKVYVTPKDSHIHPYWKTVRVNNDETSHKNTTSVVSTKEVDKTQISSEKLTHKENVVESYNIPDQPKYEYETITVKHGIGAASMKANFESASRYASSALFGAASSVVKGFPKVTKLVENSEYLVWFNALPKKVITGIKNYTYSHWTSPTNNFLRGLPHPDKGDEVKPKIEAKLEAGDKNAQKDYRSANVDAYRLHCMGYYHESDKKSIKAIAESLNIAIESAEVYTPFISKRVVKRNLPNGKDLLDTYVSAGKGGVVIEKGFSSSSPIEGGYMVAPPRIKLNIKVPPGKDIGMWVEPFTRCPGENEFIFASNSAFRVLTDMNTIDKTASEIVIDLEYIGHEKVDFEDTWKNMKQKGLVKE